MKPVVFDQNHILSLTQVTVQPVPGMGRDYEGVPQYLDRFTYNPTEISFCLPHISLHATDSVSLKRMARDRGKETIQDAVYRSVQILYKTGMGYKGEGRASEMIEAPLDADLFAAHIRAQFKPIPTPKTSKPQTPPPWYVYHPTKGMEEGVVFMHLDGRLVHIVEYDDEQRSPHYIVGFGVMGTAMCYLEVEPARIPGIGRELALFGMIAAQRHEVTEETKSWLIQSMNSAYGSLPERASIYVQEHEASGPDVPLGDRAFSVLTNATVKTHSIYHPWNTDAAAGLVMGHIAYQPRRDDLNTGWFAYQLYGNSGNDLSGIFREFMTGIRTAFKHR